MTGPEGTISTGGRRPVLSQTAIRVVIAALAVAGAAGLAAAALMGGDTGGGSAESAVTAGPAVERVIPEPGDEVLQQQRVAVVLDARYRLASLVLYSNAGFSDGVDVSAEVAHVEGLNLFEFVPGEGRLVESLSPDTNCARASFVLIARPEESDTIRWCFEVS